MLHNLLMQWSASAVAPLRRRTNTADHGMPGCQLGELTKKVGDADIFVPGRIRAGGLTVL